MKCDMIMIIYDSSSLLYIIRYDYLRFIQFTRNSLDLSPEKVREDRSDPDG